MALRACSGHGTPILIKFAVCIQQLALLSPLRPIRIGALFVLRRRDRIARKSRIVDAGAVWIALLLVGRAGALDGAFVDVRVIQLLLSRGRHRRLLRKAEVYAAILVGYMTERTLAIIKPD